MRIHTNERPFSCAVCQKKYRNTSALNVHVRTHDAEPIYSCDVCKERFVRLSSLNDHMGWHTGERPYVCTECGTEFSRLRDMKRHIRVHSGARILCLFRARSSMRLVRLKPQGPGPDRGPDHPVQRKFTKYDHFGPRNF